MARLRTEEKACVMASLRSVCGTCRKVLASGYDITGAIHRRVWRREGDLLTGTEFTLSELRPGSPMRQRGVIAVPRTSPKLTHGAEWPTNHPVTALVVEMTKPGFHPSRRGLKIRRGGQIASPEKSGLNFVYLSGAHFEHDAGQVAKAVLIVSLRERVGVAGEHPIKFA